MAGNKTLKKFKDSKIPKKGKGKITIEIPIYQEPNTKSSIIGKIPKDQEITWISKSVCDEREWIRCDESNNFGYIVGYEKDGKCNLDIGTIKEKKDEVKKEYGFDSKQEIIPITKEEIKLGNEALKEILNDVNDDEKKDDNESKTISTENDENKSEGPGLDDDKSKITEIKIEEENWDNFFENDISKIDFVKYENDKLLNEIKCQLEEESKNENGPKSDDNNKNENINKETDNDNSVSKALSSIMDELPEEEKVKMAKLLEDLNAASQEKRKSKKESNKKDKTDKKEKKKKETVVVNGKVYPMDYSSNVGNFNQALKDAKRLNNIPKNDQPVEEKINIDNQGKKQEGKVYVYKVIKDGETKNIELRDDRKGHDYGKDYPFPPHINDPSHRHFFYNGEGRIGNSSKKKEDK